jgi:hypothetical protein
VAWDWLPKNPLSSVFVTVAALVTSLEQNCVEIFSLLLCAHPVQGFEALKRPQCTSIDTERIAKIDQSSVVLKIAGKGKAFSYQVMETQKRDGILGFHPYFDIRHNCDSRVVSCTRRPQFTVKEIASYWVLLETEWSPGLLNADRRIRALENFHGPYMESSSEPQPNAPPLAPHNFWQELCSLVTTCNCKRHWSVWQLTELTK